MQKLNVNVNKSKHMVVHICNHTVALKPYSIIVYAIGKDISRNEVLTKMKYDGGAIRDFKKKVVDSFYDSV